MNIYKRHIISSIQSTWLVLILLSISLSLFGKIPLAKAKQPYTLTSGDYQEISKEYIDFLEGVSPDTPLEELQSADWLSALSSKLAYLDGFWMKFELKNLSTTKTLSLGLFDGWPPYTESRIFITYPDGTSKSNHWSYGDSLRDIGRFIYFFQTVIDNQEVSTIFFYVQSSPFNRRILEMDKIGVADWSKFITNSLDPDMIKDWACTIVVLAFAIYYFLFFWVSKEITYFWLSLFAFSICHDFAIWPLFSAGILPLAYYSGGAIYNTSILLQLLFLSLFFRTLIETKTFFPRSDRLFVAFQLGYLCLIAVNLAESLKWPSSKHFDLLSFPPDGKGDILLTYHQLLLLVVFPMLLGTFQIYKKWRAGSRSAGMAMIAFLSLAPIIPLRFLLVDILIMDLVAKSLQLLMFLLLGLSVAQRINDLKKLAIEQQVRLTEAYQRFVPKQLLSNLEKESILDVQLGDQVQKEMSILFSDIRSFTTLSESMSPEENFKFVNSYLKHMGPLVREHNGYIDKFIGDAIMALFDQSPEDAVKTAVAMLETLTDYNDGRERAGYEPIRIGVGVNTGMMMLGTLGESDRMEGSVISDAVNLAARLEGLTKLYQIPLLISETTMQQLPTDSFSIRLIDRVSVKGKKDPILVYEVLNPELPKIREGKINNIENFNKGFDLYQNQQFEKALVRFSKCFETVNEDKVCELYIHRCKNLISNGWDPETWDGVNYMDTK